MTGPDERPIRLELRPWTRQVPAWVFRTLTLAVLTTLMFVALTGH